MKDAAILRSVGRLHTPQTRFDQLAGVGFELERVHGFVRDHSKTCSSHCCRVSLRLPQGFSFFDPSACEANPFLCIFHGTKNFDWPLSLSHNGLVHRSDFHCIV